MKKNQLYIDKFEVNFEENVYPPINGIYVKNSKFGEFHVYNKLRMLVSYTRTIIIGKQLKRSFIARAFLGLHSYE